MTKPYTTPPAVAAPAVLNTVGDAAYTLQESDLSRIVIFTNASAVTVTVPQELGPGFFCTLAPTGAAGVTVAAGSGAAVNSANGGTDLAQYAVAGIMATSPSDYVLFGDVTAP